MLHRVIRKLPTLGRCPRRYSHFQIPFQDDLTRADDDDFGLAGFQLYQELPDVLRQKQLLGLSDNNNNDNNAILTTNTTLSGDGNGSISTLQEMALKRAPVVFTSKLHNPYLNLAIEDYIYNQMPLPTEEEVAQDVNFNRLMFYVNSPCVVIGKNQNPWAETNMPLLNSLGIPLVRRRSGGGTVVHDLGNVNYSFMTTKQKFDRFVFSNIVAESVQDVHPLSVNERGDIVDVETGKKVSGSAYKLSRGKSYHHGTMLLDLNLAVLRQLLARDEAVVGHVDLKSSVRSVRSPVTNIGLDNDDFVDRVSRGFQRHYGAAVAVSPVDEMMGLPSFAPNECETFVVDEITHLPQQVQDTANELQQWAWRFGHTPLFTHTFSSAALGLDVTFHVDKMARVTDFDLQYVDPNACESFDMVRLKINRDGYVDYKGSSIAGLVTDDAISDWIGSSIDGTT